MRASNSRLICQKILLSFIRLRIDLSSSEGTFSNYIQIGIIIMVYDSLLANN
jgi:hypothetical protein